MKKVLPLRSTKKQLKKSLTESKSVIRKSVPSNVRNYLRELLKTVNKGNDSKKKYTVSGRYVPSRIKVHNAIIRKILLKDPTKSKPDVYVFGGVAGSGKTTVLSKYVKEKALPINNDDIKHELSKYTLSPYKRYPLIHAAYLHEESSDIEKKLLGKAVSLRKDIILDRTLASFVKQREVLKQLKSKGYTVHMLGTNLYPHIAIIRVTTRFTRKGRYVPLEYIAEKGNSTNASVLKMAKEKFIKRARIYNTTKAKPKLMYKRG